MNLGIRPGPYGQWAGFKEEIVREREREIERKRERRAIILVFLCLCL